MRKVAPLAIPLLAACSVAPTQPTIHGETPGHTCQAAGTEAFIGKPRTSSIEAAIKRASHAAIVRWALPGYAITMDYRADRATVWLGPDHKITKISCS